MIRCPAVFLLSTTLCITTLGSCPLLDDAQQGPDRAPGQWRAMELNHAFLAIGPVGSTSSLALLGGGIHSLWYCLPPHGSPVPSLRSTPRLQYSLRGQRFPNTIMSSTVIFGARWISGRAPVTGFTAQSPGDHAAPHALLNCSLSGGDLSFNGSWDDWDWPALRSGRHKHIHMEAPMNMPSVPNGERGTGFEPAYAYLEGRWVAITLPARFCYLRLGTGMWIPRAGAQTKMNNTTMPNAATTHSMPLSSPSIASP